MEKETSEVMLDNFMRKYGKPSLRKLATYLINRKSNEDIAKEFGVSRQRVHQWQKAFTNTHTVLRPFVEQALRRKVR